MGSETSTAFDVELYKRAKESIAHGALTNSKRPECLVRGVYPTHLSRGQGCFVWDTKGNRYVDFIAGLGSSILGYAHEEVDQAVIGRIRKGSTLSLGTDLEVECAEKVKELFPFVERVRFLKTGSDACTASLRIARTFTHRHLVSSEGYHGWHDEFVTLSPPALGIPNFAPCIFNRSDEFYYRDAHEGRGVAALITEPIMTDMGSERIENLRKAREHCTKSGTLLIFDEIITGMRFPKFSVSNFLGIEPDLICLGKAIANGLPISVVGGRRNIMECDEYFVSSTFAGETLSLAAALKTMSLLQKKYRLDHLWEKGAQFLTKFNSIWPEIQIQGYPTRGVFQASPLTKALFFQESCRAGILFGPSFFFNFSHIDVMDGVLNCVYDIVMRIKTGSVKLEGELPVTPFAQKMRAQ